MYEFEIPVAFSILLRFETPAYRVLQFSHSMDNKTTVICLYFLVQNFKFFSILCKTIFSLGHFYRYKYAEFEISIEDSLSGF